MVAVAQFKGTYRVGVIGHTGRGNYGHGIDQAFCGLPGADIVAVADPDNDGRGKALARTGAPRGYADYREMLEKERPHVVAVGPRWTDQREAFLMAAIHAGAKAIYTEKPFAKSLDEADRVLTAAERRGVRIAVAHQNRAFPGPRVVKAGIAAGKIGRLRTLKAYGKQDRRGGGQDLMVLGTHMLDLMRFLAGDARWCNARVTVGGRDAMPADVRPAEEEAGLIAGDDIIATYAFDNGVTGSYESARADDEGKGNYFRMEISGTAGTYSIRSNPTMPIYYYPRPIPLPDEPNRWEAAPPESVPVDVPPGAHGLFAANQVLASDLLEALEEGRKPLSAGEDARAALEMIMAVYASHAAGQRVSLPLAQRQHPLSSWK